MIPLDVPVPPQLEQATGYHGDSLRWFAVYWQPCGDESMYDDGRHSGTGCWSGYLAWVRHPAVALEFAPYNLGSSDAEATHRLLIDRHSRKAFAAPVPEARRVLHEQWPPVKPAVLSQEEWSALLGRLQVEFAARPMPTNEEIMARMREQRRIEQEMVEWLDASSHARKAAEVIHRLTDGDSRSEANGQSKETNP